MLMLSNCKWILRQRYLIKNKEDTHLYTILIFPMILKTLPWFFQPLLKFKANTLALAALSPIADFRSDFLIWSQ